MEQKEKLVKSDDIYYRIKWQNNIDSRKCHISYLDRIKEKNMLVPFHEWVPFEKGGDIPWHRVYLIYFDNEILWDREKRYYNPELLDKHKLTSNVPLIKYNNQSKKWIHVTLPVSSKITPLPEKISVISYNALFDIYSTNPPLPPIQWRLPELINVIKTVDIPDIICFQEITPKMMGILLSNSFIQDNYYTTQHKINKYGQMIFTKYLPLNQNITNFIGNEIKKYVQMTFKLMDDTQLEIYNVHLTSGNQKNSDNKRDEQLEQLCNEINSDNKVMVVGDFNTSKSIHISNCRDVWEYLHPNNPGITYNPSCNALANINSSTQLSYRFDRILASNLLPISIDIIGIEPMNGTYVSDHYGIHATISTTDEMETGVNIINTDITNTNITIDASNIIMKPGNALDLILPLPQWSTINSYRRKYDNSYLSWVPHITLLKSFVEPEYWSNWKDVVTQILIPYQHQSITFDQVTIFTQEVNFTVVLTSSDPSHMIQLHSQLENLFKIQQSTPFIPHITLGTVDNIKKAKTLKLSVEKDFKGVPLIIYLDHLDFLSNRGDVFQIIETVPDYYIPIASNSVVLKPMDVIKLLLDEIIINQHGSNYNIVLTGSRAYNNSANEIMSTGLKNDSDYDIVIVSDIEMNSFYTRLNGILAGSNYILYNKYIKSKISIMDIILNDVNKTPINLLYFNIEYLHNIDKFTSDKTTSISKTRDMSDHQNCVIDMMNTVIAIKNKLGTKENLANFNQNYMLIEKWCKQKKIYGSNYGYLNGISILIMTLKVFMQNNMLSGYEFLKAFLKYYHEYDWAQPISLHNDQFTFNKKHPSDHIAVILNIILPSTNLLRKINNNTFGMVKEQISLAHKFISALPNNIAKKKITEARRINKPYMIISVYDLSPKDTISKMKSISSKIWKVFLKLSYVDPDIDWRKDDEDHTYKFGMLPNEFELVMDMLNSFGVSYELVK
jgi:endonuclease/exonuclease/phosphatase family metal-dependent hydrolase/2'-5' RNA ligase/uncharacterized protein (UPF0248 family)